eukprot:m.87153 g.87153  ORF g.87153 m.87153 type:complete len:282 (-) comp12232_c0_seq1:123-968(-)
MEGFQKGEYEEVTLSKLSPLQRFDGIVNGEFEFSREDFLHFSRDGFVYCEDFIAREAITSLQQEIDEIVDKAINTCGLHPEWIMSPHQLLPDSNNWVWAIAMSKPLITFLQHQLGTPVVLFSSQIAFKPPHGGRTVPWHQDGKRSCTVWIPFDDVCKDNGTLVVKPSWHKRGRLKFKRLDPMDDSTENNLFFAKYHLFEIDPCISRRRFLHNVVPIKLRAGGIEIHHGETPHASYPNNSDSQRSVLILRYQSATEPMISGPIVDWRSEKGDTVLQKNFKIY